MDDLGRLIEAAFCHAPYPGDEGIVSPVIVRGVTLRDPEREEVAKLLQGRSWRQLDDESLARLRQSIPFLSAAGFRYFLPALMLAFLDNPAVDAHSLVFSLTLPSAVEGEDLRRWTLQRFSALTSEEQAAVRLFLKHLSSDAQFGDEAALALERYWAQSGTPGARL